MSRGDIGDGWYSVLTGLAMLVVAFLLGSVSTSDDPAALVVAVVLALTGVWQLERGLRSERQRRGAG
jgi:glucose dehydrogenase